MQRTTIGINTTKNIDEAFIIDNIIIINNAIILDINVIVIQTKNNKHNNFAINQKAIRLCYQ